MAASRFAEAIPIYEDLLKAVPGNAGLLLNLALAEQMAGRPARAVPHFEAVLRVQPDNVPALLSLAAAQLQLNRSRDAIAPLRKVVKQDPNNLDAVGMLAQAEMDQSLFEEAAAHYGQLTSENGTDPRAWYGLGKAYEALATRTFERLNKNAPESPYVAILLADTRLQRRQYRSAFFFYRQAQSKSPDLPGIHAGLAQVYRDTNHADWAAAEDKREKMLQDLDCKAEAPACAFLARRFADVVKKRERECLSSHALLGHEGLQSTGFAGVRPLNHCLIRLRFTNSRRRFCTTTNRIWKRQMSGEPH